MLSRIQIIEKQVKNNYMWTGLSIKESYKLEKECLMRLSKKYECICSRKRQHFPIIKKYDDKINKLFLTINGISLDIINKLYNITLNVQNVNEQINCILHNLKKSKIVHLDLYPKNVCINLYGDISLIDFDISMIDNKPLTDKIKNRYLNYSDDKFMNNFKSIIKESMS